MLARTSFTAFRRLALAGLAALAGACAAPDDGAEGADESEVKKAACGPDANDGCAAHTADEAKTLVAAFYGKSGPSIAGRAQKAMLAKLTPELGRHVKQEIFVPGNGARFVCAQAEPTAIEVGDATRDGDDALVKVEAAFGDDKRNVIVRVRLADLKIAGWTCGQPFHTTDEARAVVRELYGAHGPYNEDALGYRAPDTLSTDLKRKIDSLPFTPGEGDPLTCAQDRPDAVSVAPPTEMGDFAVTVVRETFHDSTVEVVVAVGLPDLKVHATMCAPFDDGGIWSR